MSEIAGTQKSHAPRSRRLRWIAGAVVVILIALILWNVLQKPAVKGVPPQVVKEGPVTPPAIPPVLLVSNLRHRAPPRSTKPVSLPRRVPLGLRQRCTAP